MSTEEAQEGDVAVSTPTGDDDLEDAHNPDWERAARKALSSQLFKSGENIRGAVGSLEMAVWGHDDRTLTEDDIEAARDALYDLQRLIEDDLVPIVDGVEPYERAGVNLSFGKREELLNETPMVSEGERHDDG